jgi:hypothetical protein
MFFTPCPVSVDLIRLWQNKSITFKRQWGENRNSISLSHADMRNYKLVTTDIWHTVIHDVVLHWWRLGTLFHKYDSGGICNWLWSHFADYVFICVDVHNHMYTDKHAHTHTQDLNAISPHLSILSSHCPSGSQPFHCSVWFVTASRISLMIQLNRPRLHC